MHLRPYLALGALLATSAATATPAEDFQALLDEAWEWQLAEYPVFASRLGDRRYNRQWTDLSVDAHERRHEAREAFLRRLQAIDPGQLDEHARLNYDLFRRSLLNDIDGHEFRDWLMPINQRGGVQSLESTAEALRLRTVEDYEDWLARMASVETVIGQTMELQEAGRRDGYVPPRILMERIPAQIDAQLVETADESPYFRAFATMPDSISAAEQERLREQARETIEGSIVPAYREFSRYFEDTYIPASRESIGAS